MHKQWNKCEIHDSQDKCTPARVLNPFNITYQNVLKLR